MGLMEAPYEAFCFDEACAYIRNRLEDGETPQVTVKHTSFSDMYKQYSVK